MQVLHDEGVANYIDPESCADVREDLGEAFDRGVYRPSHRAAKMTSSRAPTLLTLWKATREGTLTRVADRPGVVADLGMCRRSLHGNREISWSTNRQVVHPALVRIGKAKSRIR